MTHFWLQATNKCVSCNHMCDIMHVLRSGRSSTVVWPDSKLTDWLHQLVDMSHPNLRVRIVRVRSIYHLTLFFFCSIQKYRQRMRRRIDMDWHMNDQQDESDEKQRKSVRRNVTFRVIPKILAVVNANDMFWMARTNDAKIIAVKKDTPNGVPCRMLWWLLYDDDGNDDAKQTIRCDYVHIVHSQQIWEIIMLRRLHLVRINIFPFKLVFHTQT